MVAAIGVVVGSIGFVVGSIGVIVAAIGFVVGSIGFVGGSIGFVGGSIGVCTISLLRSVNEIQSRVDGMIIGNDTINIKSGRDGIICDYSHKVTVHKTDCYIESKNRETFEAKSYLC